MKGSVRTKLDTEAYCRDNHHCVECGETKGLEAHHIIEDIEELNNLVTLCHRCHKRKHNMAGCFTEGHPFGGGIKAIETGTANFIKGRQRGHLFRGNQFLNADRSIKVK